MIEAIKTIKEQSECIAIILLDILMPEMSGIDILKWIKQNHFEYIPVIAVTADESYQLEALKNGAWDFIAKPIDNRILEARVHNVIARYALDKERIINQKLEKTKLEMDNLVNSIPGGIAICEYTDHFEMIYFSDGVAELSGMTREEYQEQTKSDITSIIYEEDKQRMYDSTLATLKRGEPVDVTYRIRHKNGSLVWIHMNGASHID